MSLRADLPKAIVGAWLALSAAGGGAVAASLALPAEVLYGVVPECESKARGERCVACGLTTGFVMMGRGDSTAARESAPAAPLLWMAFCANFAAAVAYSSMALLKRRRTGDMRSCRLSD